MEITEITIPTLDEMDVMNLAELRVWALKFKPFYNTRFEISELYGFKEYKKAIRYLWFYTMIENITNGINRWVKISDYPKR